MKVSVIINTINRAEFIPNTLLALQYQTFKDFEVIVVNGPSTDNTKEIVQKFPVRYYEAAHNISVSRNVGISHASGDIIAFIDDDAIPEPQWLEELVAAYTDQTVGAVGGRVYNDLGDDFQYSYGCIDKWGYVQQNRENPYQYNSKNSNYYNINIGTNTSFKRTALIEVGGFDEEIEYYHDESDVCVRLINKGYKVLQLKNAYVHHKYAQSVRRQSNKKVVDWDAIVKNTIYFGIKNTNGISPLYKRLIRPYLKESNKFQSLRYLYKEGDYTFKKFIIKNLTLIRSIFRGYKRGFFEERKLIRNYNFSEKDFKKYTTINTEKNMNIVLVTQGFPPINTDGISRYNHTLAKELASRGHSIYVVSKSSDGKKKIDFKENMWIYSHLPTQYTSTVSEYSRINDIVANTKSVYRTVQEISEKIKIDFILAPLWDVEGLSLIRKPIAPTVLTLMSPLKKVVETQWYWFDDPSYEIVYDLEKYCINNASAVMAISNGVKESIGEAYSIDWAKLNEQKPIITLPLGVDNDFLESANSERKLKDTDNVNILFVGRFEKRKGIDLLLDIIPNILKKYPNVSFTFVGNDKVLHKNKINFKEQFLKKNKHSDYLSRIDFKGYVDDKDLNDIYSQCDIFVAPSRYESFGIIFIEAMAHQKPVIGTNIGGIPEIIFDNENGYLFENENKQQLEEKLCILIENKTLRIQMGKKSFEILNEKFSSKLMGDRFEDLINKVLNTNN